MNARSTFVPRLEKLEDRSIPGSLVGLADSSFDLFADSLTLSHASKSIPRAASRWSESPSAGAFPPALPASLPSANPLQSQVRSLPQLLPAGHAAAARNAMDLAFAGGQAPGAAQIQVVHRSGIGAFAFFSEIDGCLEKDVAIVANKNTERSIVPHGSPNTVALYGLTVFINNTCTSQPVIDAQGIAHDPAFLRVAPDLGSATFTATFHALNLPSGQPIDFTVSVTWVAAGRAVSETSVNQFDSSIDIVHSTERSAMASGTVSDGTTNYLSLPLTEAGMQKIQSIDITF